MQLYSEAIQLKPDWPEGWWTLGVLQYEIGSYALARDSFSRLLQLAPDSALGLGLRGLCEFETAEYSQSLHDLQAALSADAGQQEDTRAALLYHEALLLTAAGSFEDALHILSTLPHREATEPELLVAIGLAGSRTPILPKDINPERRQFFVSVGSATLDYMRGENTKAEAEFNELFKQYHNQAYLHYLYGYLLFATDPDRASTEFTEELRISPSNPAAQIMLAWYLLLHNDPAGALPLARAAALNSPTSPTAHLVAGRALLETGDLKHGLEHLESALSLDPKNLEVHLALVHAYSEAGRKADAQRERLQCLEMTKSEGAGVAHP